MACFDQPNPFVEVVYDVPSRLPALLDSGEVDAILVSSIEYLRRDDLVIAADVGIMSNGPVASVRMLSKVPLETIKTLALDQSSMTSNMLAQIILAEKGVRPRLVTMEPDQTAMLAECDACVLIGDKGLEADGTGLVDVDLGAAWTEMTGEPFVWALWLAKRDRFPEQKWDELDQLELLGKILDLGESNGGFRWTHLKEDYRIGRHCWGLTRASEKGLEEWIESAKWKRDFVIADAVRRSGWSPEQVETYLSVNVRHSGEIVKFLATFQQKLIDHRLLAVARKIKGSRKNYLVEKGVLKLSVGDMRGHLDKL